MQNCTRILCHSARACPIKILSIPCPLYHFLFIKILCKDYPKTTEQTHNPIFTLLSFISNTIGSSLKPLKPTVEIAWSEKSL